MLIPAFTNYYLIGLVYGGMGKGHTIYIVIIIICIINNNLKGHESEGGLGIASRYPILHHGPWATSTTPLPPTGW